ncbi:tRNA dihydrouridine synthase DusB [Candidatus Woesearchaeota archaeon]|jgi:tRNA-dihydrouridine synthase B|nr:tRNA dihydrouridine synthase DusB [Candidatus Woesearchaeota archaeon]MBT5740538.1 tRNA dihydrouridine synthase DusB [Candidatus Woesearchaeota archaeon]
MLPKFQSKAFLAPMAGLSDPALRLLCKELGAGLVVTEFKSIHAVTAKQKDITKFIEFSPKERPLSVQLFGSDLTKLKQAVKIVEPHFDIIDYNMGCPSPHITQQMACSALLREPELTRKILRTMVQSTKKPISLKIRAGVTSSDKWKEIALIAEEEGVQMITLHPRTVKQGYSGKSDWKLIKELKQLVKIPVVGNGDIETPEDAKRMLDETGCDYVMIGRAAAKNPFIFQQINHFLETGKYREVSDKRRIHAFFKYLDYTKNYPTIKFANIRMQAMNFTKGMVGGKIIRGRLLHVKTIENIKALMEDMLTPEK